MIAIPAVSISAEGGNGIASFVLCPAGRTTRKGAAMTPRHAYVQRKAVGNHHSLRKPAAGRGGSEISHSEMVKPIFKFAACRRKASSEDIAASI